MLATESYPSNLNGMGGILYCFAFRLKCLIDKVQRTKE